jgi:signal recognition particle receptor subunit beta
LDGADGVIFVADSHPDLLEQNRRSFRELVSFATPHKIPYLIQLNKRDLPEAISIEEFKRQLELPKFERYEDGTKVLYPSIATKGTNVRECFEDLMTQIIYKYFLALAGM